MHHQPCTTRSSLYNFLFSLVCFCTTVGFAIHPATAATVEKVLLQPVNLRAFATPPPPAGMIPQPVLKEQSFLLENAVNFKEITSSIVNFTPAQKAFLEKNRFLLIPSDQINISSSQPESSSATDEMTGIFDSILGSYLEAERLPVNAIFVNPDIMLHTLHKYYSNRLQYIEEYRMSSNLHGLLTDLYTHAAHFRSAASTANAPRWERLQAQFTVPLILLQNGFGTTARTVSFSSYTDTPLPDDDLPSALKLFEQYRTAFSEQTAQAIIVELTAIYEASGSGISPLFAAPYSLERDTDYTQYTPRSHYASSPRLRGYFRAMIWLGQMGWPLGNVEGTADALNFAIAMSYDPPQTNEPTEQKNAPGSIEEQEPKLPLRQAWQQIMEISSFFVGYPDEASYLEWQPYINTTTGLQEFTADSAGDSKLIAALMTPDNLKKLTHTAPFFRELQAPSSPDTLKVFPQRFTASWLIGDEFTYKDTPKHSELPPMFSSLWVPAAFGSKFAQSLMPAQAALCLAGEPNTTLSLAAMEAPTPHRSLTKEQQAQIAPTLQALQLQIDSLHKSLLAQPEGSWFSALGASWLKLLTTLTAEYGEGYPLYMQSPAFQAKQLESFLGSFTELKHDTLLYEKPLYAEAGEGYEEDAEIPPVPKGFVEPNLGFWYELARTLDYMHKGFAFYGLFPSDLEEYGALSLFKTKVRMFTELAEKELKGEPISDEEYENLRQNSMLQAVVAPLASNYIADPLDYYSGLLVDVQTFRNGPAGGWEGIVYEATARPYVMLTLVNTDNTPRIALGVAFNHSEFVTPYGERQTDNAWKKRVYNPPADDDFSPLTDPEIPPSNAKEELGPLPPKNFWYDSLIP